MAAIIRPATIADVNEMVPLTDLKRKEYENAEPLFWRCAEAANEAQIVWFSELLLNTNHAKEKGTIQTLVVCGHQDNPKRNFLKSERLDIASEWYAGGML